MEKFQGKPGGSVSVTCGQLVMVWVSTQAFGNDGSASSVRAGAEKKSEVISFFAVALSGLVSRHGASSCTVRIHPR